jgi:hypothetical protein
MNTKRPAAKLERLLYAFERDVLEASDEEILAVAQELGMKPEMKGSAALFGVTLRVHLRPRPEAVAHARAAPRVRRRPKGDTPPST